MLQISNLSYVEYLSNEGANLLKEVSYEDFYKGFTNLRLLIVPMVCLFKCCNSNSESKAFPSIIYVCASLGGQEVS